MRVRLLTDDALTLEAVRPDRIEMRVKPLGCDQQIGLVLDVDQVARLWAFMVILMRWQSRAAFGSQPPEGFDQDITTTVP